MRFLGARYNKFLIRVSIKVSCDNPIIPAGQYYVNPVFPQSRSRGFSPIINLAVLCKYGLGACQSSNPDCVAPYCFECSGSTSCDWGYPFDSNCNQTGEVPATLEVDYVKIRERDLNICNSLFVYGDNCEQTGNLKEPLSCDNTHCIGDIGNLYLEDLNGTNWLSEVQVLNVNATPDIDIINFDNYNIKYRQNYSGEGKITITYVGGCDVQSFFEYFVPFSGEEYEVTNIDPCKATATIEFQNFSCNNGSLDIKSVTTIDEWSNSKNGSFDLNSNILNISYQGHYFVRAINIEGFTPCGNSLNIKIDVPPCDECCPEGFEFDGANCHSGFYFPGVEGFIYDGKFNTTRNCEFYPDNDCCPPGTTFDGANCYYGDIEPGFEAFILNNTFYTKINCEKNCCPDGYKYDGANCYSGFHWNERAVKGFIYDGNFYTTRNCEYYPSNNCCPPGTTYDGANCYYRNIPLGYDGFIYGNSFYVEPNCDTCCPPVAIFDGANCYYGIHFEEGEGFIYNNSFYTKSDCRKYPENECCPPGSVFDGANCYYGIHFEEGEGFIYNNSFYTRPLDCYDHYNYKVEKIADNRSELDFRTTQEKHADITNREIKVYPNPFTEEINIELSDQYMDIEEIRIFTLDGRLIKRIKSQNISKSLKMMDLDSYTEAFLINIIYTDKQEIFKVIKTY